MDTNTFLQTHRVFSLEEADLVLGPTGGRAATLERLKYAVSKGKLKNLARGVYATVPPGVAPADFTADRFLTAAALRPDAIFSHHSALELLGAAHSEWRLCTAYSVRRSQAFDLDGIELRYLSHPLSLLRQQMADLGVRTVHRLDRELKVTGPERTLIDGFRRPDLVGGHAEFIESVAGFSVLEIPLLFELLEAYGQKVLWAAIGWFLEAYRETFFVADDDLSLIAKHLPKTPLYLAKEQRGGVLVKQWNLIVPNFLAQGMEPNEPQR
jgi:hypothetical protein